MTREQPHGHQCLPGPARHRTLAVSSHRGAAGSPSSPWPWR